jgi:hypothetical protein
MRRDEARPEVARPFVIGSLAAGAVGAKEKADV